MEKDIILLTKEFQRIKNMGWIHTMRKGNTGVGYTFEKLIGKEEENFEIPDFGKIEIKTKCSGEDFPISLFTASPDGDIVSPIERLQEKYGYPDRDYPQFKVLNIPITTKEYTNLGNYKFFKLRVNRKEEKVELISIYKGKMEIFISWSFYILEKKIASKLKCLAIVEASKKTLASGDYYKYEKINFYKLTSFDEFINLIEAGKITIKFKISIYKKGPKLGKRHDRGTSFSIYAQDLNLLYKRIEHKNPLFL